MVQYLPCMGEARQSIPRGKKEKKEERNTPLRGSLEPQFLFRHLPPDLSEDLRDSFLKNALGRSYQAEET